MRTLYNPHQHRSLPIHTQSTHTNTQSLSGNPRQRLFGPLNKLSKLSRVNALLALTVLAPIGAQAALPEAIQTALTRAALTPADISIIVTPVGNNNASHLPPIVQVIDSGSTKSSANTNSIANIEAKATNNPTTKTTNSSTINNDDINKNNGKPTKTITVDKQEIVQKERKLHAYTDDTYTYQSLESTPPILPTHHDINGTNDTSTAINNAPTPSKPVSAPLLSHQPNIARTPASTMKLIPSFIALDTLGADFVWHTRVYHTGIIIGKRLHGDLIIQGSGDPKMTHARLQQLLYRVQKAGIRHIDGDLIIDSAVFNNVTKNPAAFDNAPLRPYNASPDGFLINFSSMGIQSYPLDNGQAQLIYTPQMANYQLPSVVNTRTAACSQANYSLAPQWQTDKLVLNAKLPSSCGEHIFYVAYPDAKDFSARVVAAKWQQLGNTLSGKVLAQESPYKANNHTHSKRGLAALPVSALPIVSYPSLTLTEQIYDINHFSNNVMTEQVALSIGAYHKTNAAQASPSVATDNKTTSLYQFGTPKSTNYPAAIQTINQWWQTHLTSPSPYLTNGSGLCRDCTLTASNLTELLSYAYSHPSFGAYVDSLGVAGVSGTIAAHSTRLPESAAIGRAWIKTGTLNNVTAMAGYVKGQSGQDYTVVGLINTEQALNSYTARPVLDAMLDWTAQH